MIHNDPKDYPYRATKSVEGVDICVYGNTVEELRIRCEDHDISVFEAWDVALVGANIPYGARFLWGNVLPKTLTGLALLEKSKALTVEQQVAIRFLVEQEELNHKTLTGELLDELTSDPTKMPPQFESYAVINGSVTNNLSKVLGLPEGLPVLSDVARVIRGAGVAHTICVSGNLYTVVCSDSCVLHPNFQSEEVDNGC